MVAFRTSFMFLFLSASFLSHVHSQFDYHNFCQRTNLAARCLQMIDSYPNPGAKTSQTGVCAIIQAVTRYSAGGMKALIQSDLGKNPTPRQKTSLQTCLGAAIDIDAAVEQIDCNVINKSTYPTINRFFGIALSDIEDCINSWNIAPAIPNMFPAITTKQNEYIQVDLQLINLFICDKPTVCNSLMAK